MWCECGRRGGARRARRRAFSPDCFPLEKTNERFRPPTDSSPNSRTPTSSLAHPGNQGPEGWLDWRACGERTCTSPMATLLLHSSIKSAFLTHFPFPLSPSTLQGRTSRRGLSPLGGKQRPHHFIPPPSAAAASPASYRRGGTELGNF